MNYQGNIYCIGRNYVKHAEELGNAVPERPVVFMKPSHALTKADEQSVQLPDNQGQVHFETELVLKFGQNYQKDMKADDLISDITVGLDLTLRDLQSDLKTKQHPWLLAKGFPNSAIVGEFVTFPGLEKLSETPFILEINGKTRQIGDIKQMIFPLQTQIDFIGKNLGLKTGDLIFTGTPEGVGPLHHHDQLILKWGQEKLGQCTIQV